MRLNLVIADWSGITAEAGRRLSDTDRYMQPDFPLTETCRQALTAYRQALRDLNYTFTNPAEVVFPPQPTIEKVKA
ncbi:tail fiber assembly protein [Azospirillum brasilense]|uniref:tail fiber assembly protein n=1 Tax=Azospirillum brasilense TaxID=192 RepID=UPI001EDC8FEE|nr:tail fiber assembly protein [Azospirillum brasilense]UKJ76610.1 phage tail assembly chaperone [Azospirillum brasilense]